MNNKPSLKVQGAVFGKNAGFLKDHEKPDLRVNRRSGGS
jgi:hypothetical protein